MGRVPERCGELTSPYLLHPDEVAQIIYVGGRNEQIEH